MGHRHHLHTHGSGFLYLVAIMDWHSRYVLAWRLSNTLEVDFCVAALEEALSKGRPQIFNTDQGMDNVFVERLWRSIKYEEVYLKAYPNGTEARKGIGLIWPSTTKSGPIKPWAIGHRVRCSKQ